MVHIAIAKIQLFPYVNIGCIPCIKKSVNTTMFALIIILTFVILKVIEIMIQKKQTYTTRNKNRLIDHILILVLVYVSLFVNPM